MATATDILPSYLSTPPASSVPPPVETRVAGLPYEALRWEDFERLCLRCARTESDIERAQLYGERGQDQAGIDLFARLATGQYRVYQCKNESDFGPAKIRAAVDKFLDGEWAKTAKEFVLCTRESLRSTLRSDEFEKQSIELKEKAITFTPWDADALNELLRKRPSLVDDFFGRQWVNRFCGADAANSLGERLDACDVQKFRRDLREFYSNLFLVHDRGLPAAALRSGTPLSVHQRYVLPWIYPPQRNESVVPDAVMPPPDTGSSPADAASSPADGRQSLSRIPRKAPHRQRVALENWLVGTPRAIVAADFGLGKTSLLRFLALDLLDDNPKLSRLATQWGDRLPVWLPFALWTRLIADHETTDTSVSDLLRKWLHSHDEERLWPLVRQALEDDRLLLLVDGLDEYSTPAAANIAGQRLAVFVKQRDLPVVAVGRAAGISTISLASQDWPVGELADFDLNQQRALATQWIEHWIRCEEGAVGAVDLQIRSLAKVDELMQELSTTELAELAKVPLLLSLIILLKLNNVTLPDDRFKAYDELLKHVINVHPQQRREVAGVGEPSPLTAEDAGRVLAKLAYTIQRHHGEGTIGRGEAIVVVEDFLKSDEGLGFDPSEARRHARELVETEGASTGLLVRRSDQEIGFFHRSLQEYLAAQHLSTLPLDVQLEIVHANCHDARWHEVLLGLLRLTSRPDDAQRYVDKMEGSQLNPIERLDLDALLTEAAVGDYNLPPSLARRLVDRAIVTIETGPWLPHRERLLSRLLKGLRQSPTGDRIRRKVLQWFPSKSWRQSLYHAVGMWGDADGVFDALWRGLYDEELGNQRAAAAAIVQYANQDAAVGDKLAHVSRYDQNYLARVAAIEALVLGWPRHRDLHAALRAATRSASEALRWAAIVARIALQECTDDDLTSLLELGSWPSGLHHSLRSEIPQLLSNGWSNSQTLKAECLQSLSYVGRSKAIDHNLALETLVRAFPEDPEVAAFLARQIEGEDFPFAGTRLGHSTAWKLLSANFQRNDAIKNAIEIWLDRANVLDMDLVPAVLVGRTPKGKAKLLASLQSTSFIHWHAFGLLEGWGMSDPEVRESLIPLATDTQFGARIAFLLPKIIENRNECRALLMSMLAGEKCPRPDFVISGLQALNATKGNPEACTLALAQHARARGTRSEEVIGSIIVAFSDDPRVRPLAIDELARSNGNDADVAVAFGGDLEIRTLILARLSPLPSRLRDCIVQALAERPIADQFAKAQLRLYGHENDSDIKTKAAIAFHRRLARSGADLEDVVEELRKGIVAYGVDQAAERQAAFCGLLELDRIDVFRDAREPNNVAEACIIPLEEFLGINYALLHCVAKHWAKMREVLGTTLDNRLIDHITSRAGLPWDALSIVASEYSPVAQELLNKIESETAPPTTSNLLRFIAAVRPKSLLLREKCIEVLRSHNRRGSADETEAVAAELVAANYRDAETFAKLLSLAPVDVPAMGRAYGPLLALTDGWPESDELRLRVERLVGQMAPWDLCFALGPAHPSDAQSFLAMLAQLCRERGPFDMSASHRIFRFCVRHVSEDDQCYQLLLSHWLRPVDDNLYASAPSILAASRGVGPLGRHQLLDRLRRELAGDSEPCVGYDLQSDQTRSAALALMDILTAGEAGGTQ